MFLEKILGLILIIYGLVIAYDTHKRPDPANKENRFAYQLKDYVGAFLAVFIGLIFVLGKLTIAKLFDW